MFLHLLSVKKERTASLLPAIVGNSRRRAAGAVLHMTITRLAGN